MRIKRFTAVLLSLLVIISSAMICFGDTKGGYDGKYWIKVNKKANVVTVYENKEEWEPVRAMLCSTGTAVDEETVTPSGTFYLKGRWNWGEMIEDVYAQYCTHITGNILFHSVYYMERYNKKSQPVYEFNRLGSKASHGCIRLSCMDAKWIYDNCPKGTKVTIYESSNAGPLGKPPAIKSRAYWNYWDPTDPDPKNPYYLLKKPVIRISDKKKLEVEYGSSYRLKSYVTAKDPNTFMNLTDILKVSMIKKYNSKTGEYVKSTFSTKKIGTYRITYKVDDKYSGKTYKSVILKVTDGITPPVIYGAADKTVEAGYTDATLGVTAAQKSCDRTEKIKVYVKAPQADEYKQMSYSSAKEYVFDTTGMYVVKFIVKNRYKPYKEAREIVTVNVVEELSEE